MPNLKVIPSRQMVKLLAKGQEFTWGAGLSWWRTIQVYDHGEKIVVLCEKVTEKSTKPLELKFYSDQSVEVR